jgi:hypothetical protein
LRIKKRATITSTKDEQEKKLLLRIKKKKATMVATTRDEQEKELLLKMEKKEQLQ